MYRNIQRAFIRTLRFTEPSRRRQTSTIGTGLERPPSSSPPQTFPLDEGVFTEHPVIFDTHKLINYLKQGGFTEIQSEAITNAMVRVSQQSSRHANNQLVTKQEFVSLRSELSILEKADFALLKTDINAIEKRMDTSVAEIYTAVERVENRVIKWVIAVAGAIGLAIIRLTTTSSGSTSVEGRFVPPPPPSNLGCEAVKDAARRKGVTIVEV